MAKLTLLEESFVKSLALYRLQSQNEKLKGLMYEMLKTLCPNCRVEMLQHLAMKSAINDP